MENRCCCDFRVGRFRLSEQGSCSSGNWSVFLFEVKCSSDERCDKDCKGDKLYLLKIVSFLVDLVKMRRKEEESLSLLCTLLISLSLCEKSKSLLDGNLGKAYRREWELTSLEWHWHSSRPTRFDSAVSPLPHLGPRIGSWWRAGEP